MMRTGVMRESLAFIRKAVPQQLEEARLRYYQSDRRTRRSASECPTLSEELMRRQRDLSGSTSLSPYTTDLQYNPLR